MGTTYFLEVFEEPVKTIVYLNLQYQKLKMKIFLFCICFVANVAFGQDGPFKDKSEVDIISTRLNINGRAPAPLVPNCDCQCSSYLWADRSRRIHGNCRTAALFCYVSQEARRFCNDVKPSQSQSGQFYSYEACAIRDRNTCINSFFNQEKEKYAQDKDGYLEKTRKAIRPKTNVGFRTNCFSSFF